MDAPGLADLRSTLAVLMDQLVPGLRGGLLVERRARVMAIRVGSGTVSLTEARCSVDVQPLTPDGTPDPIWPTIGAVAWPVSGAGAGRGVVTLPSVGAVVALRFLYGDPSQPAVTPLGWLGAAEAPSDIDSSQPSSFLVRQAGADLRLLQDGTLEVTIGGELAQGGNARLTISPSGAIEIKGVSITVRGPTGEPQRLATEAHVAAFSAHTHATPAGNSGPPTVPPMAIELTQALRGA